jgi:hypothetical protein
MLGASFFGGSMSQQILLEHDGGAYSAPTTTPIKWLFATTRIREPAS